MHTDRRQLLLPFRLRPAFNALDFVAAASNRQARAWLEEQGPEGESPEGQSSERHGPAGQAPDGQATAGHATAGLGTDRQWPERRLAIWGPAGCGKSHLLHVWAERRSAVVLAGPGLRDLDLLPSAGAVALDDADAVAPETLLLHLLNSARERGLQLLLAGRLPPSRWAVALPDLSSRLRAIAAAEIGAPDDALLGALLMRLLADRQLSVAPAVQSWLLTRLPRAPAVLRAAVDRLDRESLIAGRAVTRVLAERVLRSLPGIDAETDDVSLTPGQPALPLIGLPGENTSADRSLVGARHPD